GALEPAGVDAQFADAKAALAERHDLQHAELRHVPFGDAREAADFGGYRRRAHFGTLADRADAKGGGVAQAQLRHVHITLLEDAQRQPAAGKQHRVQRKQRYFSYGALSSASTRWRTSTRHSGRKAFASSS